MKLEFWFEFASTYSYLSASRIQALAKESGITIRWKPFLLGPIFRTQGWDDSPFNLYPVKGLYMWRDMERRCKRHRLPFTRPSSFPRNGMLAARVACAAEDEPWLPSFVRAVFRANFAEDREIGERDTVAALLRSVELDPAPWLVRAESADVKQRLREQVDAAKRHRIFGAPSFVVGEELFWGDDRLEEAIEWAQRVNS